MKKKKTENTLKEEIDLISQIFFIWKYYLKYFLNLMYNHKQEFTYFTKKNENLNIELKKQFTYIFVGLITANIIIYALEEYQFSNFDVHYIINDIHMALSYFCFIFYFIIYALILNFLVCKKIHIEPFKKTLILLLKVFNLLYPFLMICILITADSAFLEALNTNFKSLDMTISKSPLLYAGFSILYCSFFYLMWLITSSFIEEFKTKKIHFIKKISIYLFTLFLTISSFTILFLPITFSLNTIVIKENFCDELMKKKFKITNNYKLSNFEIDIKKCYKDFP